jgi:phosphoribosylformimino-5-aminoimidazole carboxamide ribotide isomerase
MLQRSQLRLPSSGGFQLLPAIDLRGGQVVRLAEGDFARETVYGTDPAEVARGFAAPARAGSTSSTWTGPATARRQTDAVARIVAAAGEGSPARWPGGLRDEAAVAAVLDAGAARAVVGTAALRDPDSSRG